MIEFYESVKPSPVLSNRSAWVTYDGGPRPVAASDLIEVRTRDGRIDGPRPASEYDWTGHCFQPNETVAWRRVFNTTVSSTVNAVQIGGAHYKVKGIQPWDYIAANGLGFFDGNAVKYLTRWREKGGVEDLKKARHYIDKLIEMEVSA